MTIPNRYELPPEESPRLRSSTVLILALTALALIILALRLRGAIDWSWYWVAIPFIPPAVIALLVWLDDLAQEEEDEHNEGFDL